MVDLHARVLTLETESQIASEKKEETEGKNGEIKESLSKLSNAEKKKDSTKEKIEIKEQKDEEEEDRGEKTSRNGEGGHGDGKEAMTERESRLLKAKTPRELGRALDEMLLDEIMEMDKKDEEEEEQPPEEEGLSTPPIPPPRRRKLRRPKKPKDPSFGRQDTQVRHMLVRGSKRPPMLAAFAEPWPGRL